MRVSGLIGLALTGCNLQPVEAGPSAADFAALQDKVTTLEAALVALEDDCVKDTDVAAAIEAALAEADVDLSDYATKQEVSDGDAAVEAWVEAQAYLTADDLVGYAQLTDLSGLATGDDLDDLELALQQWVQAQGFLGSGDLAAYATISVVEEMVAQALEDGDYATEVWVSSRGYLTAADLSPYATTSWVLAQAYATDAALDDVAERVGELESLGLDGAVVGLMEDLALYLSVDPVGDSVWFSGANVFIDNGSGDTWTSNGLGNLVMGYNGSLGEPDRDGSHNVVIGDDLSYSGNGTLQVARNIEAFGSVIAEGYTGRGVSPFWSGHRSASGAASLLFGGDPGTTWLITAGPAEGVGPSVGRRFGGIWLVSVHDQVCSIVELTASQPLDGDVACGVSPGSGRPLPVMFNMVGGPTVEVSWLKLNE